ncbi:MAG: heme-binding protein [Sedimenticola sp.]
MKLGAPCRVQVPVRVCVPGNLVYGIHTSLCVVEGGFSVVVGNEIVGGIGICSGTPQQDMACARSGWSTFWRTEISINLYRSYWNCHI